MEKQSIIQYSLSKKKKSGLILTTLATLIVGAGILYLSHFLNFGNGRGVLIILGFFNLIVFFFCVSAYIHLKKENFTAIYISDEGVYDISTGNHIGTVLWKDVTGIRVMDDMSNLKYKYIVLKVSNPNEYIYREQSKGKRRSLELKHQYYGSPICFSNRALDCNFEELKQAVYSKFHLYQETHPKEATHEQTN